MANVPRDSKLVYRTTEDETVAQAFVMLLPSVSTPGLAVPPDDPDATPLPTGGGGGGGGGAVTIADGADVVLGALADAAATAGGAGTLSAKMRLATTLLQAVSAQQATLINGRAKAEPLGLADGTPRQLAVTTTSASVALTSTVRRISITARGSDMRYVIQAGSAPTAVAGTSNWIWERERLDLAVPASAYIAAIIATGSAATTGTLEITELTEPA